MKKKHSHLINKLNYLDNAYKIGIALNVAFLIAELIAGIVLESVALISDVWHNLSDVFALVFSMTAFKLMDKEPNERFTFGYKKSSIHVSLLNACILFVAVGAVALRAVQRLANPQYVEGSTVAWVAAVGMGINLLTVWLFYRHRNKDLNVEGAYLHIAADALGSVGIVLAGIVIYFTNWYILDPIIALVNSALILISAISHMSESLRLSLDGVPAGLDAKKICNAITEKVPEISDIHYVHLWAVSTAENAFTAHIVVNTPKVSSELKKRIKHHLAELNITYATLEFELPGEECELSNIKIDDGSYEIKK